MSGDELTAEEHAAIVTLQHLARRWPKSLTLFSWSGSLAVLHTADRERLTDEHVSQVGKCDLILAFIDGIPNDGGDP